MKLESSKYSPKHKIIRKCGVHNHTLFNDPTRDSIANNFIIDVYCRCQQILYQIAIFYKM